MSASLRGVAIVQGDTLEALATKYLGYPGRWREIAALNRLRAPYISDKPADWFGTALTTGILAAPLAAGAESVTIAGERADAFPEGSYFFLEGFGASGYGYEAPTTGPYNATTGALTLTVPTTRAWAAGTRYRVCRADNQTSVARPGDTLVLPEVVGAAAAVIDAPTDFVSLYGRDLLLPRAGNLVSIGGALATVGGVANAGQALRFRASLPFASAFLHPEEGNRALDLIGEPQGEATANLARNYTRAALLRDSRVAAVPLVTARATGTDSIELHADVTLAGSSQQVRINEVLGG